MMLFQGDISESYLPSWRLVGAADAVASAGVSLNRNSDDQTRMTLEL